MAMPEASVNEHSLFPFFKYYIRPAWKLLGVKAISVSKRMQEHPYLHLGHCIFALDP